MRMPTIGIRKLNKAIQDLHELRRDLKLMDKAVKKEVTRLQYIRRSYRPTIDMMDKVINAKADLINERKRLQRERLLEQQEQTREQPIVQQEEESEPQKDEEMIVIRNE